jgi:hypothetical protein
MYICTYIYMYLYLYLGNLVAKLSHSNSNLIIFNSVTHVQCVPQKGLLHPQDSYNSFKDKTDIVYVYVLRYVGMYTYIHEYMPL